MRHQLKPFANVPVRLGQFVMTGIKKIAQHAIEAEIEKPGLFIQNEGFLRKHHLIREQTLLQQFKPLFLIFAPLIKTTAAKFTFLVSQEIELLGGRHIFQPVNVIQAKGGVFNFALHVAPQDGLNVTPFLREETEFKFVVDILGDYLGITADFKNDGLAITEDGHLVITLASEFPDERTVVGGDVRDLEPFAAELQNSALDEAEWAPGKLNQFDHA